MKTPENQMMFYPSATGPAAAVAARFVAKHFVEGVFRRRELAVQVIQQNRRRTGFAFGKVRQALVKKFEWHECQWWRIAGPLASARQPGRRRS